MIYGCECDMYPSSANLVELSLLHIDVYRPYQPCYVGIIRSHYKQNPHELTSIMECHTHPCSCMVGF